RVHSMHDPTEGGLATACWELARAGDVGLLVNREQVPVLPEGRALCEAFGLDPLGTIASGSLLMAVDPADAEPVIAACRGAGIACAAIGKVTAASQGVRLASGGVARPMPSFPQDEVTKVFAAAGGPPGRNRHPPTPRRSPAPSGRGSIPLDKSAFRAPAQPAQSFHGGGIRGGRRGPVRLRYAADRIRAPAGPDGARRDGGLVSSAGLARRR